MSTADHITNSNIVTDALGIWPSFFEAHLDAVRWDYRGHDGLIPPVLELIIYPPWQSEAPKFNGNPIAIEFRFQNVDVDNFKLNISGLDDLTIELETDQNWNPPCLRVEMEGLGVFYCSEAEVIDIPSRHPKKK
jgi:hypothetical protein